MNLKSKAFRRLGVVTASAVVALGTPFALGTANAAASTLTITPNPAYGTVSSVASGQTPDNPVTLTVTYTPSTGATAGAQTFALSVTGSAFFPASAGSTGNYQSSGNNNATCTTAAAGAADTPVTCTVKVADHTSEAVTVTASDATDVSVSAQDTVNFNGLHYSVCSQTGENTTANCVTQGAINTALTLTTTYLEAGTGAANKAVFFTLTNPVGGNAHFDAAQPTGTAYFSPTSVHCTTDASGHCNITVVDATADTGVQISGTTNSLANYPNASAAITVNFSANAVTPSRIDQSAFTTLAPTTQTDGLTIPGDAVQVKYTVYGACTIPAGSANKSCTGTPLAGITGTISVDHGFITPNCTSTDATKTNNYANCTFSPAGATGGKVGQLSNSGTSGTFTTDNNGQFTATYGIARDTSFDSNGVVVPTVTFSSGGATLHPQQPGNTFAPSDATNCPATTSVVNNGGAAPNAGCTINFSWTTRSVPLNGGSASIVVLLHVANSTNYPATTGASATNSVPDVNRVVYVVHLTDQFGNLTSGSPLGAGSSNAMITKTGAGNLVQCPGYTGTDPCTSGAGGIGTPTTQPNGTVTQVFNNIEGSFTNLAQPTQTRFEMSAAPGGTAGGCNSGFRNFNDVAQECTNATRGANDGAQTDALSWKAPVTTFKSFVAPTASTPAVAQYDNTTTSTQTDTLAVTFYNQLVEPVVTFSTQPSGNDATGTAVTVTATVDDQHGNAIVNQNARFLRSGTNESSCNPTYPNGYVQLTSVSGKAGFAFTCNSPGTSHVAIVVEDVSGNRLGSGTQDVIFSGANVGGGSATPSLFSLSGKTFVARGSRHTLTGSASPGVTVSLYRGGIRIASTTSNSSGAFHFTIKFVTTHGYFVTASGKKSNSIVMHAIPVTIHISGGKTNVKKGSHHSLRGSAPRGTKVFLLKSGHVIASQVASGGNHYSFRRLFNSTKSYQVRSDGVTSGVITIHTH